MSKFCPSCHYPVHPTATKCYKCEMNFASIEAEMPVEDRLLSEMRTQTEYLKNISQIMIMVFALNALGLIVTAYMSVKH